MKGLTHLFRLTENRIKLVVWMSIHGCKTRNIEIFPTLYLHIIYPLPKWYEMLSWKGIKSLWRKLDLASYFPDTYQQEFEKYYRVKDWQGAKNHSNELCMVIREPWKPLTTYEDIDLIPF